MRHFDEIFARSAKRHGEEAMRTKLTDSHAKSPTELAAIPDHRWLSSATRCVFQAGFNWRVIENKWPGFEEAFEGFDIGRWVLASDDDISRLASDTRIVRNPQKINSVPENARFFGELSRQHGGVGRFVADWPAQDFVGLLETFKKGGNRLGGTTCQYFLRFMGRDSFLLSRDVCAALIREGVVDKQPTSKKDMAAVQSAFNRWMEQSGHGLTAISRTLACSIDAGG